MAPWAEDNSFESILAILAVIEMYPEIGPGQRDLPPPQYWERALRDIDRLMRRNAVKVRQALGLMPQYRREFFYRNYREACAVADTRPGVYSTRGAQLVRRLDGAVRQDNGTGVLGVSARP